MNKHYVYIYLDPSKKGVFEYGNNKEYKFDFEPFYVGMGKNYRLYDHLKQAIHREFITKGNRHKFYKIKQILNSGNEPIILKIKDLISVEEAKELEIMLIALIGRSCLEKGPLTNLTEGGDRGVEQSGAKNRMFGLKGKDHPASHWKRTPEHLHNQSESHKGSKNAMFGKKWTEERKREFSEFMKEKRKSHPELFKNFEATPEYREDMRKRMTGDKNPRWGAKLSDETKKLIAQSHIDSGRFKGANNYMAKEWRIISPCGEIYEVKGELKEFCKNRGLGHYICLVRAGLRDTPVTRGKSKGWMAKEIKK